MTEYDLENINGKTSLTHLSHTSHLASHWLQEGLTAHTARNAREGLVTLGMYIPISPSGQ